MKLADTGWRIEAVVVNHNTSAYTELMLRSLIQHHPQRKNLALTVYDNDSQDGSQALQEFARSEGMTWQGSGFPIGTVNNSHGDVLRRFVIEHPDCTHYLFLDADVVFLEENTIFTMLQELENTPDAFGIGEDLQEDLRVEPHFSIGVEKGGRDIRRWTRILLDEVPGLHDQAAELLDRIRIL